LAVVMTDLTIQDAARRSGLSEPTLRYYEEVGLIGPIARDPSSGHRRYRQEEVDTLQALACLRAMGVGIGEMRTYQANRELGHTKAGEQRDLLLRHAERVEGEIETLRITSTTCGRRRHCGMPATVLMRPRKLRQTWRSRTCSRDWRW
jgi:DNA-binding transcriptional MerR regulator